MGTKEDVFTITELSKYLRVHPTTIYRLLRLGKIPGFRVGNKWRFDRTIIQELKRLSVPSEEAALPPSRKEGRKPPQPKTVSRRPKKAVRARNELGKHK
jgi:excisionase family DNA binding protein